MSLIFRTTTPLRAALECLLVLVAILLIFGNDRSAQASLYWAAANGVTPSPLTKGIQSNTPTLCFVGNAVDVRLARVAQIIDYLHQFEWAANIKFYSLAGRPLADELGAGGSVQNLKCPAPTTVGGLDYYNGDIRMVLPGTNVDATTPVPGLGCATDKLLSDPDCTSWDSNHLTCAIRGYDNAVWVKTWHGDGSPAYWTDFSSIGGVVTSGPSLASRSANHLDAVVRGQDNGLWYNAYNGVNWTGWSSVSGTAGHVTGDPDCTAVASNWLECSVRWDTGDIQQVTYNGSTWSLGDDLGQPLIGTAVSGPSVASTSDQRLDVVARGTDNDYYQRTWTERGGWSSNWVSIGSGFNSSPDCEAMSSSRLDCFGRKSGNQIYQNTYTVGSGWDVWISRGSGGGTATSGPTVASRYSTELDLFSGGSDSALWTSSYLGSWSGWSNLGQNSGWGSWSNPPWTRDDANSRACLYNLKLGDNPWCPVGGEYWPCASNPEITPYLNHTLHEVGHALGLAHEQARDDVNAGCTESGYGGGATNGKLTPYDRYSVMHYMFPSCGINGNYDYTGLSYYDKLGLHMLYPPSGYPAEIVGNMTIQTGQALNLTAAWKSWGANMGYVASNFVWKIDNATLSTSPDLSYSGLSAGYHTLSLTYTDFLNRNYSYSGRVWVLEPAQYTVQMGALQTAESAALAFPQYLIDVPAVRR